MSNYNQVGLIVSSIMLSNVSIIDTWLPIVDELSF